MLRDSFSFGIQSTRLVSIIPSHSKISPFCVATIPGKTLSALQSFETGRHTYVGESRNKNEAHEQTAFRELQEEIGFTAAHLDFLRETRPLSKYFALQSFIYLARELTPRKLEGDEDYPLLVEQALFKDFEQLIAEKRLLDSHAISALYMARSFLEAHE